VPDPPKRGPGSNQYQDKPSRGSAQPNTLRTAQLKAQAAAQAYLYQPGAVDPGLVLARNDLITIVQLLGPQARALTVVGAQAVYEMAGDDDLPVSPATSDADFVVAPELLLDHPRIDETMLAAGFHVLTDRPGIWLRGGSGVDFLVPETVAGSGRRSVTLPHDHGTMAVGRAAGLELALVDRHLRRLSSFDTDAAVEVHVAGHAALLCAKAHKLHERLANETRRPDRVLPKDALDMYRLMRTSTPAAVARVFKRAARDDRCAAAAANAADYLCAIFGPNGRGAGLLAAALPDDVAAAAGAEATVWVKQFQTRV
jgi:hypothetical protein